MRIHRLAFLVVLVAAPALAAPVVAAQPDLDANGDGEVNCDDFDFQEEAQAALERNLDDPYGLDGPVGPRPSGEPDVACEDLPSRGDAGDPEPRDEPARRRPRGADIDCIDFGFQEEAQAVLEEDPTDPYNLDPSGDGFACSELPSRTGRVVTMPSTGAGAAAG